MPRPFAAVSDGLRLKVRLTPRARRSAIDGLAPEADGSVALKVAVTAVPEKGQANEALIELLAREWRIARSRITLESGASDRRKLLHLAGDPMALESLLTEWLAKHGAKA
ncbi:MAG TPA: DUF167 family protein [Hypericibacter adhaerens]|jgi:uncharacterized protein YggU (UPF0235/DUF167 family)|uniref:UPF0235 protein FRZ61_48960 n=1 Tax=Hypericibacter adhaerens TaxID=2602016 RepID=A0A5J6N7T6_9PROT|nr:DUF167 family protein [Hypericibacter adhaerens]QEX24953.1 UPF0235 protein [Hypericibacter adhaerens]HWA42922.1 DUF167 family protein [Hypericibacter adhaerens]